MVELLRGCSAICTTSHGSYAESYSIKMGKKSHVPCFYCGLNLSSAKHKTCRRLLDDSTHLSVASECGTWNGFKSLEMPAMSCVFSSRRRDSLVTFSSLGSVLLCEGEVSMSIWNRADQLTMSNCEQKLPPWVTPGTQEEVSVEPRSGLSSSNSERKLCISKMKLHFLEEKDEERLSKRILSLSRSNKVRSALELYTSMEVTGLQPNAHACNSLLSCLVRKRLLTDALRIFDMIRKREMATGHTYSLILKAVASSQGYDSALKMFKGLEGEEIAKKNFDVIVYNTMIAICGKAKNWVETERMWRSLKQNSLSETMITYCLLVSTFVQCGQTELAVDAYHEMIQKGLEPGQDIMKAIIASCTKEGKWALALNVFKKMLDSGTRPNMIAYNSMINCLGKAGEADLAFKIYDLMKSSGHTPDAYTWSALLSALYRCSRYGDALRVFESIKTGKSSQLNAHVYNIALMSCEKLGLWERSLQLLWEMETSGMLMSTVCYNHVIGACETARKPKIALQVYRHMVHQKCAPDTFTYLSLIRACVWGSLWTEVEEILEHVGPDSSIYNALIQGFCLRDKIALAKKLYEQMRSSGIKPDGKTRALMLQHLPDKVRRHPRYTSRARP